MYPTTFDPILEHQPLSRLRLLKPLRPPEPGVALVLAPHDGALRVIRPGETIPDARYGTYHTMYKVDIAEHALAFETPLLSRDANFAFRALVSLTCWVEDPDEVVARGIRDIAASLREPFKRSLRQVSKEFDIDEFHNAEQALNAMARGIKFEVIPVRNINVELLVDEDEAVTSGRRFRDLARDTRLDGIRRERHLEMMHEHGAEGLLAEIVEREGPRPALEWIASAEAAERTELLKVLDTVMRHSGSDREPFDAHRAERMVLDRLTGGSTAPFGGTRSRVRGTIAASATHGDEAPPELPETSTDRDPYGPVDYFEEEVEGAPSAAGGTPATPPEDEPIGLGEVDGRADESGRSSTEPPVRRSRVRGVRLPEDRG